MNINQSSTSSLSRPTNDPLHEQQIIKDESHFERSVPGNYHHSSYEYLTSGSGREGGGGGGGGITFGSFFLPIAPAIPIWCWKW